MFKYFLILLTITLLGCYTPSSRCPQPQIRRYWDQTNVATPLNVMEFTQIERGSIQIQRFIIAERDSFFMDVSANFASASYDCEVYAEVIRERFDCMDCDYSISIDRRASDGFSYRQSRLYSLLWRNQLIDSATYRSGHNFSNDTIWSAGFGHMDGVGLLKYQNDTLKLIRR